jgi:transposase InsO family protein
VAATPQISEAFLISVLEQMLGQLPFLIRAFHSDYGGEFINQAVSRLLQKLLVEQAKSRPRHSMTTVWWRPRRSGGAQAHGALAHWL